MAQLEDLTRCAQVLGILPDTSVTIVDVKWYRSTAVGMTYKDPVDRLGNELLYRDQEVGLPMAIAGHVIVAVAKSRQG